MLNVRFALAGVSLLASLQPPATQDHIDAATPPLSFRVWSGDKEPQLLKVIDFEIGRVGGKSLTAAIGETSEGAHSNFGILDVDAPYERIRNQVVEVVSAK